MKKDDSQFTPQQIYVAKLMLWSLRCDFIEMKGATLTPKATLYLPPFMWRLILECYCYFKPDFKKDIGDFLGTFAKTQDEQPLDLEKHLSNYN